MIPFDSTPRTRIVFGEGSLDRLGALVSELGGARVLLVSDPGIAKAGYVARAEDLIRAAGHEVFTFTDVGENPTTDHVEACRAFAAEHRVDLIVGLGGGSSMDCAKGTNFVLTNGGAMRDYQGVGLAEKPMLPMIAVPTTAGTGSETQSFALISDAKSHAKMACGDPKAACRVALLDPALTVSMPREVAAMTGMDAVSHALESYVCRKSNPLSRMYAREAWRLLAANFPRVFADPADTDARGGMLLGSSLAGLAIENSMLGATHSCANPLTARFGTTHGKAIAVMLPHVIRRNGPAVQELYEELIRALPEDTRSRLAGQCYMDEYPSEELAAMVETLRAEAGLPENLRACEVTRDAFEDMAAEALGQWTARFNPADLNRSAFLSLYQGAY